MATQTLTEDELTRVSTQAAETLTDSYYNALNNARHTLSTFYLPTQTLPSGRSLPVITYNGTQSSDPLSFQKTFESQMPYTYFDVQSLNAHVINPAITPTDPSAGATSQKDKEANISVLVQVSGSVRLIERKDGPLKGFADTLVLVPNKEAVGAKGKAKSGEGRSWVVQSQNFRFVV